MKAVFFFRNLFIRQRDGNALPQFRATQHQTANLSLPNLGLE